jgi:hypothetical protein
MILIRCVYRPQQQQQQQQQQAAVCIHYPTEDQKNPQDPATEDPETQLQRIQRIQLQRIQKDYPVKDSVGDRAEARSPEMDESGVKLEWQVTIIH